MHSGVNKFDRYLASCSAVFSFCQQGILPENCTTELAMEAFAFACGTIAERIQFGIAGAENSLLVFDILFCNVNLNYLKAIDVSKLLFDSM